MKPDQDQIKTFRFFVIFHKVNRYRYLPVQVLITIICNTGSGTYYIQSKVGIRVCYAIPLLDGWVRGGGSAPGPGSAGPPPCGGRAGRAARVPQRRAGTPGAKQQQQQQRPTAHLPPGWSAGSRNTGGTLHTGTTGVAEPGRSRGF